MRSTRIALFIASILVISTKAMDAQLLDHPDLIVTMIGGPVFTVQTAIPNDPDIIRIPPANERPLVIRATITNIGTSDFVGIPSQTLFSRVPGEPLLLSGVFGMENGQVISEGDGLRDLPASFPFLGGFVLKPGESRVFVWTVIYGLFCNGCLSPPGSPALQPAACGTKITLHNSIFDIRIGTLVNGRVEADPNIPAQIREPVQSVSTPSVIVVCGLSVLIDIKPASFPNEIRHGLIPVALLGSHDFSLNSVDSNSLRFGPARARPVDAIVRDDVNGDDVPDLIAQFRAQDTGLTPRHTEACLEAAAGLHTLVGCDSVRVIQRQRVVRR
jgi:hypothetical protein